jgi:hypothetical protein
MVDVRAVSTNPHVLAVGGLYNSYFSGINAKQYAQVLALYDPGGSLNPNNPTQVAEFTQGVSTTQDSQVVLWTISNDPAQAGDLDTRITFRSEQQAGFGPADAPGETCTLWDNTYELRPSGGSYRIFDLLNFTDSPC